MAQKDFINKLILGDHLAVLQFLACVVCLNDIFRLMSIFYTTLSEK